jgi:FkbM family methyltransferase
VDIRSILKTVRYGLRFRTYGFEIKSFDLPKDGLVEYAQWLHPFAGSAEIRQSDIDELRNYLSAGDVAIDIGANQGYTTLPIAIAVGKNGLVLAFEPNKYVFPILQKNATLNQEKTNIVPLMLAATENDEEIVFYYGDPGFCNGGRHQGISIWKQSKIFKQKVSGINLENFLRREYSNVIHKLKYIKIDTEGYDLIVIRSIRQLISECRPYIKAEVFMYTSYEERIELYHILRDLEYNIYKFVSEINYKGEIINSSNLMQWKHYDIFCIPQERD